MIYHGQSILTDYRIAARRTEPNRGPPDRIMARTDSARNAHNRIDCI